MRCIQCRRPFSLLEVTVQVDAHDDESAELCEQCDATYPEQLRPSLGGAVAFRAIERKGYITIERGVSRGIRLA